MADPQIGVYGLGTMGSALALNMAENGIRVAVSNRSPDAVTAFLTEAGPLADTITGYTTFEALVAALPVPRVLLAMIPSTGPMDSLLDKVIPLLAPGDTVIDAGNADFHDTRRRTRRLEQHGLHFVGIGVSGGEAGARHGPSIMVGGAEESWKQLRPILQPIAAKYDNVPCVAHLGADGAGHFVKTVHNGIEYADMQLIAEVFDLLRNGLCWPTTQIAQQFTTWNDGPLGSYLFEITGKVLGYSDSHTGQAMVDVIRDAAGQKGTGRWTVIEAVKLGQSATMIEAAIAARSWSSEKETRKSVAEAFGSQRKTIEFDMDDLEPALMAARVMEYAQGFRILEAASQTYDWELDHKRIAEIWRAGCIIRAKMLDDIADAFGSDLPHHQLLMAPYIEQIVKTGVPRLRKIVSMAIAAGFPVPVLSSALSWFDTMRQPRGTAGLIQAQRDFFGHHGFDRIDGIDEHHGPWWE